MVALLCRDPPSPPMKPLTQMEFAHLKLPLELCRKVETQVLAGTGTEVEELVVDLLEELTRDTTSLDNAEDALLEQRLRDLGYL